MKKAIVLTLFFFSCSLLFNSCMMMHSSHSEHSNQQTTGYTCSMHPEVHSDKPDTCPKCGMELVLAKSSSSHTMLWSGLGMAAMMVVMMVFLVKH